MQLVDENIRENPIETLQLSGTLGNSDPLGHFDFWPNGGKLDTILITQHE